MILSVSTLVLIGCQGCEAVPVHQTHEPVSRVGNTHAKSAALPLVDATAGFNFKQVQTEPSRNLAVQSVPAQDNLDIDFITGGSLSSLRLSSSPAVADFESRREARNVTTPARDVRDFDAALAFSAGGAQTGFGFDVGVVPRFSMNKDGEFKQRRVGGEIRIGQNFDQRGENIQAESWYIFAGADGEALVYEPDNERDFTSRMALRDQVTVGDMQAGVSISRGGGQISLSYIHREVEYKERNVRGEETEDFAGISFTLRR